MTGYVDIAIPLVSGLLILLYPKIFTKPTGIPEKDILRLKKLRKIGFALLGVAAIYLLVKLLSK